MEGQAGQPGWDGEGHEDGSEVNWKWIKTHTVGTSWDTMKAYNGAGGRRKWAYRRSEDYKGDREETDNEEETRSVEGTEGCYISGRI